MIVQHDGGIVGLVVVALEKAVSVDMRGSPVALRLDLLLPRPGGVEHLRALLPRQRLQPLVDGLPPSLGQRSMVVIGDGRRAVVMQGAERRQPRARGAIQRHRGAQQQQQQAARLAEPAGERAGGGSGRRTHRDAGSLNLMSPA